MNTEDAENVGENQSRGKRFSVTSVVAVLVYNSRRSRA
jgi:hypothetical protein